MTINNFQTVIALLNGMIGGSILVLPLVGIQTGYVSVVLITLFLGLVCGYTAYLIIKHLGKAKTINQAIQDHFNGDKRYSKAYNIFIGLTFFPWCSAYFHLLVFQIKGLLGINTWLLPLGLFIFLLLLTLFLKNFQLGQKVLAYGIISIVGYVIFLTWAQVSAPIGQSTVPPLGKKQSSYAAILMGALAIHDFIIQIIIHNPDRRSYTKILILTYVIGCSVYTYMGLGSFAIVNRVPSTQDPQIITEYFPQGQWQVHVIQVLYSIHLVTALPQFILISKVRMFQAFGYQQQPGVQLKQIVYTFVILFMAYLLFTLDLKVAVILEVSGSLMSLFYVIVIPVVIHLKCLYFDKSSGYIQSDLEHNKQIIQNSCECDLIYPSKTIKNIQLIWIVITALLGTYITVFTLYQIFFEKEG